MCLYCSSNFSASSWYIHFQSSLAFSLHDMRHDKQDELVSEITLYCSSVVCGITAFIDTGFFKTHYLHNCELFMLKHIGHLQYVSFLAVLYLSFSAFRSSTLSSLRRSLRIFFFFSLSVCFLGAPRLSVY